MASAADVTDFFPTQKGFTKLHHNGHMYTCDRESKGSKYWKCVLKDCSGRAISKEESVRETKGHYHVADIGGCKVSACLKILQYISIATIS